MSTKRTVALAILAMIAVAGAARAGGREFRGNVVEFATMDNGSGAARILFKVDAAVRDLEDVAIWRATLRVPVSGEAASETLRLHVYPVSRNWNAGSVDWNTGWDRPGGDFDREMYARGELALARGGAQELEVDVTHLLKEIVEAGMPAHGFLVTVNPADGEGLRLADLPRFGSLAGAELEIRYRSLGEMARRRDRSRG
jgi:hypothetical protein